MHTISKKSNEWYTLAYPCLFSAETTTQRTERRKRAESQMWCYQYAKSGYVFVLSGNINIRNFEIVQMANIFSLLSYYFFSSIRY